MTTSIDATPLVVRPPGQVTVTPVRDGSREIGAWITGPGGATYRPVIDVARLMGTVVAAASAVAIASAVVVATARRRPAIGQVTMGPGGWVSIKGLPRPSLRPESPRPWWARLLRAHRLTERSR
jgi:hypothetical protein